jgi:hypothetical protein
MAQSNDIADAGQGLKGYGPRVSWLPTILWMQNILFAVSL